MKNIIIILVASIFIGCGNTVNHQNCLIYGDTREIVDTVYLNDNGMHVDLVMPTDGEYVSYGWGAEQFFLYVDTWDSEETYRQCLNVVRDGKKVAMREIRYYNKKDHWIPIPVDSNQLKLLYQNIDSSYVYDDNGDKIRIPDPINNGWYYRAVGEYSLFNTCNTWTNDMLKNSNLYARKRAYLSEHIINLYKYY